MTGSDAVMEVAVWGAGKKAGKPGSGGAVGGGGGELRLPAMIRQNERKKVYRKHNKTNKTHLGYNNNNADNINNNINYHSNFNNLNHSCDGYGPYPVHGYAAAG